MSNSIVYLNGEFIAEKDATLSVMDRGFLFGDAIYETLRAEGDNILFLPAHLDRLFASAKALRYKLDENSFDFEAIIKRLIKENNLERSYIRITISRGEGTLGYGSEIADKLTLLIHAKHFAGIEEEKYKNGVPLITAATRRNAPEAINPQIKSVSNLNSLLAKLESKDAKALDVVMLNNKNHVCECSASNIFWLKGNSFFTPSTSTGILAGVTRSKIIAAIAKLEMNCEEGEYTLDELKSADELFITSTSIEVLPVVQLDETKIADGRVGKLTKELRKLLHESYNDTI